MKKINLDLNNLFIIEPLTKSPIYKKLLIFQSLCMYYKCSFCFFCLNGYFNCCITLEVVYRSCILKGFFNLINIMSKTG
jgi:hypothetical protein